MSVDRKNGPNINKITTLEIPPVERIKLNNGIEVIYVNMGTQNLVQLEVLYKGGRHSELKKGVSRATARLLKEGTQAYTGPQIAEKIDFYGANIGTGASLDYSYAKIFTLNKHFQNVLPILEEVLFYPSFPEEELKKYKENSVQKLKVEMAKTELVAYKAITEKIYGNDHAYGYNSTDDVYANITRNDLIDYYHQTYGTDNCTIIVSGRVSSEVRRSVEKIFGSLPEKKVIYTYKNPINLIEKQAPILIKAEDQVQSAIKIGRRLFRRDHKDFADIFILNTVLGGYFGSRLMSSLREEKGYTYNIYSSLDMMINDGYFNISTEVGNEYLSPTINGIYEQMEILRTEEVGQKELEMVKNYLSGNFLNMVDGPFKVAGMSKVIALNELTFNFYQNLMRRIHSISSKDILNVAQEYFRKEDMVEIIVGNPYK